MTSRIFKLRRPRFINLKNLYSWPSLLYSFKRYTPLIFQDKRNRASSKRILFFRRDVYDASSSSFLISTDSLRKLALMNSFLITYS